MRACATLDADNANSGGTLTLRNATLARPRAYSDPAAGQPNNRWLGRPGVTAISSRMVTAALCVSYAIALFHCIPPGPHASQRHAAPQREAGGDATLSDGTMQC